MAPEVEDGKYTSSCDIYSVGIILFEMFYYLNTIQKKHDVLKKLKTESLFPEDFGAWLQNDDRKSLENMICILTYKHEVIRFTAQEELEKIPEINLPVNLYYNSKWR